jgi:hypothetical protein
MEVNRTTTIFFQIFLSENYAIKNPKISLILKKS